MLSFALKVVWFSLSLSGLTACWVVFGVVATTSRCFWGPVLYCIGCTLVEGIFCIGMEWQMNPLLMPHAFCIAQTILTGLGFFLVTGVATAFAYDSVFKSKEGVIELSTSVSLPWRPLFIIPVIIYPMSSSLVQILCVLLLEAVEPTDDLQCDAIHPLWVRFLGYAGNPLAFSLAFFIISFVYNFYFQRYTKSPHVTNLTALPPRNRGKGRRYQRSPRPFPPFAVPTPSPLPSPHPTIPRRVPIKPGFASPVLSARQFHLPFTPVSPTIDDSEDKPSGPYTSELQNDFCTVYSSTLGDHYQRQQFYHGYEESVTGSVVSSASRHLASPSPGLNEFSLPSDERMVRQKESNDFLKYLNEYKEKERHSGESDVEKISRDAHWTQKSGTTDRDDLSSLRWDRGDDDFETVETSLYVDHWASSWADGALRKFVGGQYTTELGAAHGSADSGLKVTRADSGLKVTEDSESYYFTAEEGGSRAQNSRSPENEELFRRYTSAKQKSKSEIGGMSKPLEQPSKKSITWRIIKVQLPITLVLVLATLSTLIDVINQSINPSSTPFPQPTPFGTHHVVLLLLVWGPVFAFGGLPVVRQKLFFFRSLVN